VWSKREVLTKIKLTSINNNNNKPRSNLGTKYKTQNHKHKIKREEKQTHKKIFIQFGLITYYGGEIDLYNPLSMSFF